MKTWTIPLLAVAIPVATAFALPDRIGGLVMLSPLLRLSVQLLVACTAVFGAGLLVDTLGAPFFTGQVQMGWFAVPFALWFSWVA